MGDTSALGDICRSLLLHPKRECSPPAIQPEEEVMFMEPYTRIYTGEGHSACYFCGKPIEGKRAIEPTPNGQQYFCWAEKNKVTASCFQRWQRKETKCLR